MEFLLDTGFSEEFTQTEEFFNKALVRNREISEQVVEEGAFVEAVDSLFKKHGRLELAIAGWIDQAVLEWHGTMQGDRSGFEQMLKQADRYRPDQNGDVCLYYASQYCSEVLAIEVSFESSNIRAARYLSPVKVEQEQS